MTIYKARNNALNALARADTRSRLRKGGQLSGKRWPFSNEDWKTVKNVVQDEARKVLGDAEYLRVQSEVAKAISSGSLTKDTTRSDFDELVAEVTTNRLGVRKVENVTAALIAALRKGAKREKP